MKPNNTILSGWGFTLQSGAFHRAKSDMPCEVLPDDTGRPRYVFALVEIDGKTVRAYVEKRALAVREEVSL